MKTHTRAEVARQSAAIEWVKASEARQTLSDAGICPDCLQAAQHHYDEPFSTCACGTGEDTGERPMQRLQRLEAALPDESQMLDIRDLASLGGTHAEMVVTRGMYGNAPLPKSRMQHLAWGGYANAFEAINRMTRMIKP
jgi:hypothetical protein